MDGSIRQSGTVTPRHAAVWTTTGIIEDGGSSAEGNLTSLGITASGDSSFAINDGPVTGPYSAFSLGINQTVGGGLISVDSFGGAPQLGLHFRINGNLSSFSINPDGTANIGPVSFTNLIVGTAPNNILTVTPGATSVDAINFAESGTGGFTFAGGNVLVDAQNSQTTLVSQTSPFLVRYTNVDTPGPPAPGNLVVSPVNVFASDYPGMITSIWGVHSSVICTSTQFAPGSPWPQHTGANFVISKDDGGNMYIAGVHITSRETNNRSSATNAAQLGMEIACQAGGADDGGVTSAPGLRLGIHFSQTTWPGADPAVFGMGYNHDGGPGAVTNSVFGVTGTVTYQVFDARTAGVPPGYTDPIAALRMSAGQIVDFNGASTSTRAGWIGAAGSYLQFVIAATNRLQWTSGGLELFSINDHGTVQINTSAPNIPSIVMGVENSISFTVNDNRVMYYTQVGTSRLVYSSSGYGGTELLSITDAGLTTIGTDLTVLGNATITTDLAVVGKAGFQGTAPIAKPTVTGSKGANAALASLMTALAAYGLVLDSTT